MTVCRGQIRLFNKPLFLAVKGQITYNKHFSKLCSQNYDSLGYLPNSLKNLQILPEVKLRGKRLGARALGNFSVASL